MGPGNLVEALPLLSGELRLGSTKVVGDLLCGSETLVGTYKEDAARRFWRAQHLSFWMTSIVHIGPESTEFDATRSFGER